MPRPVFHISRWAKSTFWRLSAGSSTFCWWCCPWCPATCCAGCPTASWRWWPPLANLGQSLPQPTWCPPSWPSSARSSTPSSTYSSTTRLEPRGFALTEGFYIGSVCWSTPTAPSRAANTVEECIFSTQENSVHRHSQCLFSTTSQLLTAHRLDIMSALATTAPLMICTDAER